MFPWTEQVQKMGFSLMIATNRNIKPHTHETLEFAYILQGTMEHHIHGSTYILHPGDYFIVDHGISHSYRRVSQEKLHVLNLLFYPSFIDRSLANTRSFQNVMNSYLLRFCYQNLYSSPTGITFHDDTGRIRALLDIIQKEFHEQDLGFLEYIRGALVDVLILTMRKIGKRQEDGTDNPMIRQICKHMEIHYREKLSLKAYAQANGYSLPYLSRLFHSQMGMSFTAYLQRLRLNYCCHLLETTNKNISRIAQEAGYEYQKYFNQLFKRQFSMTPRQFRAMQKGHL